MFTSICIRVCVCVCVCVSVQRRRFSSVSYVPAHEHARVGLSVTAVNRGFRCSGRVVAVYPNDTVDVMFDGEKPMDIQNFKYARVQACG